MSQEAASMSSVLLAGSLPWQRCAVDESELEEAPSPSSRRSLNSVRVAVLVDSEQHGRTLRPQWLLYAIAVVGVLAAAAMIHTLGRRSVPSLTSAKSAEAAELFEAARPPKCQRCPAGDCDRVQETGECMWYPPPIDGGGAYHCRVQHCTDVPEGILGVSKCWEYSGMWYFSVGRNDFPCKGGKGDQLVPALPAPGWALYHEGPLGGGTKREEAQTEELEHQRLGDAETAAAAKTAAKVAQRDQDRAGDGGRGQDRSQDRSQDRRPQPSRRPAPRDETSSSSTAPVDHWLPEEEESMEQAKDISNLVLAAYWDIGDCGPGDDDQNSDWCGGQVYQPTCMKVVPVARSLCLSGVAVLDHLIYNEQSKSYWVYKQEEGCSYEYFAQYVCLAETSTTTSSSTRTSTTQTKTSTTKTSTTETHTATTTTTLTTSSSTTTTVRTTTRMEETLMLQKQDSFEGSLLLNKDRRPDEEAEWAPEAGFEDLACTEQFRLPPPPALAPDLNGVRLGDMCYRSPGPHYVQIIGDWGGIINETDGLPVPAKQRPDESFVWGVDNRAQLRVASQMAQRAKTRSPDYILNVGDNFYWSGLAVQCGISANTIVPMVQFDKGYEQIYTGEGLDGKPWFGVLGNHDYGGYRFNAGWDQQIAYSWKQAGRWVIPAQYYRQVIRYPGFSVDYFFLDTNHWDAQPPPGDTEHNICGGGHIDPALANCGAEGPTSPEDCAVWFATRWEAQQKWLGEQLPSSTSEWQVVVTHFPPTFGAEFWKPACDRYGIDLVVTGHSHAQELHASDDKGNFLAPTAYLVSGGGGGITSESPPTNEGLDDQYGFFELTLSKEVIEIQSISHGGFVRGTSFLRQRHPATKQETHGDLSRHATAAQQGGDQGRGAGEKLVGGREHYEQYKK